MWKAYYNNNTMETSTGFTGWDFYDWAAVAQRRAMAKLSVQKAKAEKQLAAVRKQLDKLTTDGEREQLRRWRVKLEDAVSGAQCPPEAFSIVNAATTTTSTFNPDTFYTTWFVPSRTVVITVDGNRTTTRFKSTP